jgi:ParB-like nuclease domain
MSSDFRLPVPASLPAGPVPAAGEPPVPDGPETREPAVRRPASRPTLRGIAPDLQRLAVAVSDLQPDPANAREHGERSITAIAESLRLRQRKPIVAKRTYRGMSNVVLAGNGTLQAARRLGWSHIAVSWFDGTDDEALEYALRDNRTSDLSHFDNHRLAALQADGVDLLSLGWSGAETRRPARARRCGYRPDLLRAAPAAGRSSRRATAALRHVPLPRGDVVSLPDLRLDFVGRDAVAFSCHRWHYSHSMPSGRLVCFGAWEDAVFIGAVVFGRGASAEIGSPFGLRQDQICELCRVALGPHRAPTSQIVALAVRLLRKQSPRLRLVVSYADPEHGHVGVLYQSMNWLYLGTTNRESLIRLNGRLFHPRTVTSRYGTRSIVWLRTHVAADAGHVRTLPKHRYVVPLDDDMRRQLAARVRPYPRRAGEAEKRCGRMPPAEDGANPIPPLHHHDEAAHG